MTAGLRIAYEEEYAAGNLPLWRPYGTYWQNNDPVLTAAINRLKARAAPLQGKYVERVEISNLQRNVILVYFKDGSHSTRSGNQGHAYFDGDFAMWVQVNNKQMDWGCGISSQYTSRHDELGHVQCPVKI